MIRYCISKGYLIMDPLFKSAISNLHESLIKHGYDKEASELIAFNTSTQTPGTQTQPQTGGRFQEERPPQQDKSRAPIYKGQPGSVAPVLELSKIIDHIEQNPSFKNLPQKVQQGILKVKKMTSDAFRYASTESEASLFGGEKNPVRELQNFLLKFDKANPNRKMPEEITRALNQLNFLVSNHVSNLPKEKTLFEKGKDVAKGMYEKGKGVVQDIAEKGKQFKEDLDQKSQARQDAKIEQKMKRFEDSQENKERENSALTALKESLSKYKMYKDIFYRLPGSIIKALQNIGLGLEDLGNQGTAKVACHINSTLLGYIRSKEAYSNKELSMGKKEEKEHADVYKALTKDAPGKKKKPVMTINQFATAVAKAHLKEDPKYYTKLKKTFKCAMDFSGINNMITPEGNLDERELSRVIRLAIAAELDAVHLYELIVDASDDPMIKEVLQDIADEEKVHASELNTLLSKYDKDNEKFISEGKKEVEDLIKK